MVLGLLYFLLGNTDGNETASCTEQLLVPRRKDNFFWDTSNESENLVQDVQISKCDIKVG